MIRKTSIVILLILIANFTKLSLAGKGFQKDYADETRYRYGVRVFDALRKGNGAEVLDNMFTQESRPGYAIVNLLPVSIRFIVSKALHKNINDVDPYALFGFNFIIFIFLLVVHYRFSLLLLKDPLLALLSVLLYSTATNSYIYLRHAYPYDVSLLIIYWSFYVGLKAALQDRFTYGLCIFIGLAFFANFTIYPAYFPLMGITLSMIFFCNLSKHNFARRMMQFGLAFIVASSMFILLELMSRLIHKSYFMMLSEFSGTIVMGSFNECLTFLFKYLFRVDQFLGLFIIAALCIMAILFFVNVKSNFQNLVIRLFFLTVLFYFVYAGVLGFYCHKMVMYGRILHQFFPIIFIVSVYALSEAFKRFNINTTWLVLIFSVSCLIPYSINLREYLKICYPQDAVWRINDYTCCYKIQQVSEYEGAKAFGTHEGKPDSSNAKKLIAVNVTELWPIASASKIHRYEEPTGYKQIFSKPDYLTFKAYQFEGFSPEERAILNSWNPSIRIYLEN